MNEPTAMTHTAHTHEALAKREDAEPLPSTSVRKKPEGFEAFPSEWQALIQELEIRQLDLRARRALGKEWLDTHFVEGSPMPSSTWNMLRNGTHPMPGTEKGIKSVVQKLQGLRDRCRVIEQEIANEALRAAQRDVTGRFIETEDYLAVKSAIANAGRKVEARSEERLIVYVAPTRGGKTWMKRKLVEDGLVTWEMSGLPSWRSSYTAVLLEFAAILGVDSRPRDSARILEAAVLRKAKQVNGVLWIEEIQALCRQAQEFVKNLLNQTTLTIIISLTPKAHGLLRDFAGDEESQLLARCEATLMASAVTPQLVRSFAPDLWSRAASPDLLKQVADAANERGALSLVREICATLARLQGQISQADVGKAIRLYRMAVPLINTRRALPGMKQAA